MGGNKNIKKKFYETKINLQPNFKYIYQIYIKKYA